THGFARNHLPLANRKLTDGLNEKLCLPSTGSGTILRFALSSPEDCVKLPRQPVHSALLVCFLILLAALFANAQQNAPQIDPKIYGGMKWRLLRPFRVRRVIAVTG